MATQIATPELPVIRAAGGILLRNSPGGDEVMIVFRARHQDWTLPKGKLKDGESFQEGALREVEEETGCRCRLGDYLGMISYAHQGVPKVVMFWRMVVVEEKARADSEEISEALWLPVPAAIQCLTYAQEKSLLGRMVPQRPAQTVASPDAELEPESESLKSAMEPASSDMEPAPFLSPGTMASPIIEPILESVHAPRPEPMPSPALESAPGTAVPFVVADAGPAQPEPATKANNPLANSMLVPETLPKAATLRERRPRRRNRGARALKHELDIFRVEVTFLVHRGDYATDSWASAAEQHLDNAEKCLESNDLEGGRATLRAARRYAVLGLSPAELAARAQVLRDEALKMFSWRGPAIQRLLATSDDKLTAPRVSDAMLLRDEDNDEQRQRAWGSTLRLWFLFSVCAGGALALMWSSSLTATDPGSFQDYAPLGFLGLLGSAISAAQQIIHRRNDGKVPGVLMMLALVLAGAVAGLGADAIYHYAAHYFKLKHIYDPAVYVLAFTLGYSAERTLSHFAGYSREHVTVHY
jgi:8-oxo-dGTP diphosphatase